MGAMLGAHFLRTMEGILSSPTDFLFLEAAMAALTESGLTKWMGRILSR